MTILLTLFFQGGSPGLVVMGRDLHSKGCGSNPSTVYWMDIFSHLFVLKICNVCLKRPKINEKGRDWPIFKKALFFQKYRQVLSGDVIHVRRADMQSIDAFMHINNVIGNEDDPAS